MDKILIWLKDTLMALPAVLIALSFHEFAHGYASWKLGDPTAKNLGRLTLSPFKHLDPLGFVCLLFFGFGWAKPVPVNARYYKNPRVGMAITAAAGPLMNLVLGFFGVLVYKRIYLIPATTDFLLNFKGVLLEMVLIFCTLNISLCVFNLIPIPPLDGSRIAFIFMPPKWYFGIMKYERYIYLGLIVLMMLGVFDSTIGWLSRKILIGFLSFWRLIF